MNINILLGILEVKGIVSHDEAVRVAEHVANAPQSTYYQDGLDAVITLLDTPAPPVLMNIGPVGPEQAAEEAAARAAQPTAPAGGSPIEAKPQMPSDTNDSSVPSEQNIDPANQAAVDAGADKPDRSAAKPDEVLRAEKEGGEHFERDTSKPSVKKATDTTSKK